MKSVQCYSVERIEHKKKSCPLKYTFSVVWFTFHSHSAWQYIASFTFKLNLFSHSFFPSLFLALAHLIFPFRPLIVIYFGENILRIMYKNYMAIMVHRSKYWCRWLLFGRRQTKISKWHRLFFLRWIRYFLCPGFFSFARQMSGKHLMYDDKWTRYQGRKCFVIISLCNGKRFYLKMCRIFHITKRLNDCYTLPEKKPEKLMTNSSSITWLTTPLFLSLAVSPAWREKKSAKLFLSTQIHAECQREMKYWNEMKRKHGKPHIDFSILHRILIQFKNNSPK